MTGHEELPIEPMVRFQSKTLTRTERTGKTGEPQLEPAHAGFGLVVALVAVLAAAVVLAGLPVAAGLAVLLGIPARTAFVFELLVALAVCAGAAVAAWRVAVRRLAGYGATGIAVDL